MKRPLSYGAHRDLALVVAGTSLVAGTYGLVRLAYGLFLPDIDASLDLGPGLAGLVSSGGSLAYCAGALVGLATPHRRRGLVAGALLTGSLGAAGMALAPGAGTLAAAAVLGSAGAGLASPGLVAVVERNLPASGVPRAQATVNAGTGPGLVVAGVLALVLLPHWRLGFAVAAVLTAAAGAAVLALDRATPPTAAADDGAAAPPATARHGRALLRPAVAALLLGAGSAAVWTYGRQLLVEDGAGEVTSTIAWIALGLGGLATVLTARRLAAVPAARAWAVTASASALAVLGLAAAADRVVLAWVACAVFGWAFIAASSALIAWASERWPSDAAAGTALVFVALVAGQAAGSSATGALAADLGLRSTFVAAAVVALLGALVGVSRPTRHVVVEPSGSSGIPGHAINVPRPCRR